MRLSDEQVGRLTELERNGRLAAADVLDDARDPASPLHDLITWDAERAAYEYQLAEAREIVRSVEYSITRRNIVITAPRYIADPTRPGNHAGYARTDGVAADPTLAVIATVGELNRALGVLRRAERVAAALDQVPEIGTIVGTLTELRDRLANGGEEAAA